MPRPAARRRRRARAAAAGDRKDVQAVEQVLAQPLPGHRLLRARGWWRRSRGRPPSLSRSPPTRVTVSVSSTRRSLTCSSDGHLRDLVEEQRPAVGPLEVAPVACRSAPVKLPRSWPNSSLSMRVAETAPQLTGRKGCLLARLSSWIVWATISLPVPVSPVRRTRGFGAGHLGDQVVDPLHRRATRRSAARSAPGFAARPAAPPISSFSSRVRETLARAILRRAKSTGFVR